MTGLVLLTKVAFDRMRAIRDREEGQAAVEYGVLLALILVAALAFIPGVGTAVAGAFSDVVDALGGGGGG